MHNSFPPMGKSFAWPRTSSTAAQQHSSTAAQQHSSSRAAQQSTAAEHSSRDAASLEKSQKSLEKSQKSLEKSQKSLDKSQKSLEKQHHLRSSKADKQQSSKARWRINNGLLSTSGKRAFTARMTAVITQMWRAFLFLTYC